MTGIKLNPSRRNCIGWTDKNGNQVWREDFENEKYEEYVAGLKNKHCAVPKEIFIPTLWDARGSVKKATKLL